MLRKTMAVGPFEPTAFCVTGGTGVAKFRDWRSLLDRAGETDVIGPARADDAALRDSCRTDGLSAAIFLDAETGLNTGGMLCMYKKEKLGVEKN